MALPRRPDSDLRGRCCCSTIGMMGWAGRQFYTRAWASLRHWRRRHEHADRPWHRRGVSLFARRHGRAAGSSSRGESPPDVYYEAVILIIAFVLAGNAVEARAKRQTGAALRALAALQPKTARVVRGDQELDIPIGDVRVGDVVAAAAGRARAGRRRSRRWHERRQRIDADRRADAGVQGCQATGSSAARSTAPALPLSRDDARRRQACWRASSG